MCLTGRSSKRTFNFLANHSLFFRNKYSLLLFISINLSIIMPHLILELVVAIPRPNGAIINLLTSMSCLPHTTFTDNYCSKTIITLNGLEDKINIQLLNFCKHFQRVVYECSGCEWLHQGIRKNNISNTTLIQCTSGILKQVPLPTWGLTWCGDLINRTRRKK